MTEINNRYDFVLLFDVKDGNPNGDPDAGNTPRVDPETLQGLVTDVCLKRKIRNAIGIMKNGESGYDIYVKERAVLSVQQGRAYEALGLDSNACEDEVDEQEEAVVEKKGKKGKKSGPTKKSTDRENVDLARDQMCKMFYDVRTFGAVMSLKENNAGQVRGPIQITFARSIDPVITTEHCITRMAVATRSEAESQGGENRTIGRKSTIPYGLYRAHGFISASLAHQTKFSEEDLNLFWEALHQMFEHDRSAARGLMSLQKLVIFKHDSELGNAHSHKLFNLVNVVRKNTNTPPRDFSDYEVTVGEMPQGVTVIG